MFDPFHFLQPLWLLALLPLAVLLWWLSQHSSASDPWRKIIDPRLAPLLLDQQTPAKLSRTPLWLMSAGWLLAVLALANPVWEKIPQAVIQTSTSRVIVLDLSRSMLATDLKPSRLARARFKVEDILAYDNEGQTGLVVFAGDAFSVTPLTRDTDTIRAQLKALEPAIMPAQGSRTDLGLLQAQQLLQQAGVQNGEVILIADSVEDQRTVDAARRLRRAGYRVSVLGVGTTAGAPLPDGRGGVTQTASGKPLLVKLDSDALQSVAQAGGGRYSQLSGNNTDIHSLLDTPGNRGQGQQSTDLETRQWKQQGPLLTVLLLPLAALAFRRGWLLVLLLCAELSAQPKQAMAFNWDDLWLRKDQQAAQALQEKHYQQAAELAEDPLQRGSAVYKQGDYQQALDAFQQADGADAAYNRGNALARLGKYQQAIDAYDEALRENPDMDDAKANKAAVEALLKKQQQQKNQQSSSGEQNKQEEKEETSSQSNDSRQNQQSGQNKNAGNDTSEGNQDNPPGQDQQPAEQQAENKSEETPGEDAENQFENANRQAKQNEAQEPKNDGDDLTYSLAENQRPDDRQAEPTDGKPATSDAESLASEEQIAARQWLRRIPDDPGGLLRRKFLYQYRQRGNEPGGGQDW